MSTVQVAVRGDLIDEIALKGYGFLRVGVDIDRYCDLHTELILEDLSGERSPIQCIVTGIRDNEDQRIISGGRYILKVQCGDVDIDDLIESGTVTGTEGMSVDFAAVDAGYPISPGMLTPTGACATVCQTGAQPASYGPSCNAGCAVACQTKAQGGSGTASSSFCATSCQTKAEGGKQGGSCNTACQTNEEGKRSGLVPPSQGCAAICQTASQVRQISSSPTGLLKTRDRNSMEEGALWVWDRRFYSKYGQTAK